MDHIRGELIDSALLLQRRWYGVGYWRSLPILTSPSGAVLEIDRSGHFCFREFGREIRLDLGDDKESQRKFKQVAALVGADPRHFRRALLTMRQTMWRPVYLYRLCRTSLWKMYFRFRDLN